MIRFFRQLRQNLLAENKFSKYLLYVVVEIFIVIIGILMALQVDNWNESRNNKTQAKEFRRLLTESVSRDIENIQTRLDFFRSAIDFGYLVQNELKNREALTKEDHWQFLVYSFHVSQIWNFTQLSATYNEAQNPDILELLGRPELLNSLQRYYTEWPLQLGELTGGTMEYRNFIRSIIPMSLQEYMWDSCYTISVLDIQDFAPCEAPPPDTDLIEQAYLAIVTDSSFSRILTRRLSTLYTRNIVYENILKEAEDLVIELNTN
ncbi:hypothetical protein ACT6NV_06790 [Robiginitalea sp. IMCC44478]|uniref:hypothetical protein n=1 Tax=Robiginitalea sp. IMCC44478 TaxID=3459122 RepID=UPI004043709B